MLFMLTLIRVISALISRSYYFSVSRSTPFSGGGGPIQLPPFACCRSSSGKELPDCVAKSVRTRIFEMELGCPAFLPGQLLTHMPVRLANDIVDAVLVVGVR